MVGSSGLYNCICEMTADALNETLNITQAISRPRHNSAHNLYQFKPVARTGDVHIGDL